MKQNIGKTFFMWLWKQIQYRNMQFILKMEYDKFQCQCKKYPKWKKDFSSNPSTCTYENSIYLKSIIIESVIVCDEIVKVTDNVSTNLTNTVPAIWEILYQQLSQALYCQTPIMKT